MEKQFAAEVLICGSGAAGLTMAIELARRGISFRLIEKMDSPFQGSRGKGIQPRTLEVFEDLGILDKVCAVGGPYPPVRLYNADGSVTDTDDREGHALNPTEPYQHPVMIPQFHTERVLRERLMELGGHTEFGCELAGFEQDSDGVSVRLKGVQGNKSLRVRWLIGADGGRSFIRQALGIGFPGKTLGVRAVVADVELTGLQRNVWHKFSEGDLSKQILLCPLPGTDSFQIQGPIASEGETDLSSAGLQAMVASRTGRDDILVQSVSWSSAYSMNARLADSYREGRVFLVGDAAHIHPPTGGQGLNTSVQDAYNLGWKLAAVIKGATPEILDTYEEERRPVAASMLGLATKLLDAAGQGQMQRGREVRQLDIGYPHSSLALEEPKRAYGLRAGYRAPDGLVRGAAGQPIRMFDLFKGEHWTLIGYEVERALVTPRTGLHIHTFGEYGDLVDDDAEYLKGYSVRKGDWVLVRPDGYVCAIVASHFIAVLETYLTLAGVN
ncbi:FAD-dependent oxidoreductase [Acidovorax sp. NCPPB 3576]|uniref:FAD-dependent oxidoreductase n=1 Tax=Acidovorax sp. NCPPB 3576 TaxID=2940488 RepID=UPI00234B2A0A|nr:FAD-dependent oxidoreductase [Acidovorax sp. NCPPB 3576]WCM90502.1 FAD-dependent oxidoreductase [Acidovorax sp. NCPPB 3576]